jgi:hypothetical protein
MPQNPTETESGTLYELDSIENKITKEAQRLDDNADSTITETINELNHARVIASQDAIKGGEVPNSLKGTLTWGYDLAEEIDVARYTARTEGHVNGASEEEAVTYLLFLRIRADDPNVFLDLTYKEEHIEVYGIQHLLSSIDDSISRLKIRLLTEISTPELPHKIRNNLRRILKFVDRLSWKPEDKIESFTTLRDIWYRNACNPIIALCGNDERTITSFEVASETKRTLFETRNSLAKSNVTKTPYVSLSEASTSVNLTTQANANLKTINTLWDSLRRRGFDYVTDR